MTLNAEMAWTSSELEELEQVSWCRRRSFPRQTRQPQAVQRAPVPARKDASVPGGRLKHAQRSKRSRTGGFRQIMRNAPRTGSGSLSLIDGSATCTHEYENHRRRRQAAPSVCHRVSATGDGAPPNSCASLTTIALPDTTIGGGGVTGGSLTPRGSLGIDRPPSVLPSGWREHARRSSSSVAAAR